MRLKVRASDFYLQKPVEVFGGNHRLRKCTWQGREFLVHLTGGLCLPATPVTRTRSVGYQGDGIGRGDNAAK